VPQCFAPTDSQELLGSMAMQLGSRAESNSVITMAHQGKTWMTRENCPTYYIMSSHSEGREKHHSDQSVVLQVVPEQAEKGSEILMSKIFDSLTV